ncbi:hypothetical protein [Methylorubrum populi]
MADTVLSFSDCRDGKLPAGIRMRSIKAHRAQGRRSAFIGRISPVVLAGEGDGRRMRPGCERMARVAWLRAAPVRGASDLRGVEGDEHSSFGVLACRAASRLPVEAERSGDRHDWRAPACAVLARVKAFGAQRVRHQLARRLVRAYAPAAT